MLKENQASRLTTTLEQQHAMGDKQHTKVVWTCIKAGVSQLKYILHDKVRGTYCPHKANEG